MAAENPTTDKRAVPSHPASEDVTPEDIFRMFYDAMRDRKTLTISYQFKSPWTVRDLDEIERNINGCIVGVLNSAGGKIGRRKRLFRFNMLEMKHDEDGLDPRLNLKVTMDFAKMFPRREAE